MFQVGVDLSVAHNAGNATGGSINGYVNASIAFKQDIQGFVNNAIAFVLLKAQTMPINKQEIAKVFQTYLNLDIARSISAFQCAASPCNPSSAFVNQINASITNMYTMALLTLP